MSVFFETLQQIKKKVLEKKGNKERINYLLEKYTHQKDIIFEIRNKKLILKTHPLIKQRILLKKQSFLDDCFKEGIEITSIG